MKIIQWTFVCIRDSRVSRATAYRYLHEALGVIADRAPDLPEVLQRLRRAEEPFVCLDGTVIRTDRVARRNPDTGRHPWYSGPWRRRSAATCRW